MSDRLRTQSGKFAAKSDEPRRVRSLRLTDSVWEKLEQLANEKSTSERRITRADLIEEWMQNDHVIQEQLELFEQRQPESSPSFDLDGIEKDLQKMFVTEMKRESKLGEPAKAFKAAKKAFSSTFKALREKLG